MAFPVSRFPIPLVAIISTMTAIDGGTTLVGVIGDPVAPSLSPRMHNAAFDALEMNWRYVAFRVAPAGLGQALRGLVALGMVGVNITIPHKESAVGLLDELDSLARQIAAVNTVRVSGGRLMGFNTDAAGVVDALTSDGGMPVSGRPCVVVGAGGGGRAAAFALAAAGASRITVLNRTERKARNLADAVDRTARAPGCNAAGRRTHRTAVETLKRWSVEANMLNCRDPRFPWLSRFNVSTFQRSNDRLERSRRCSAF